MIAHQLPQIVQVLAIPWLYVVIANIRCTNMKKIQILPKYKFDYFMKQNGWNDLNIPSDTAFISICCKKNIKENYLRDFKHREDFHWFKRNHPNVLNVDFDDVIQPEIETRWGMAYGIDDYTAKEIVQFALDNMEKNTLMIHCMAGKSRSVAVGKALSELLDCKFTCFYGTDNMNEFVYKKIKDNYDLYRRTNCDN